MIENYAVKLYNVISIKKKLLYGIFLFFFVIGIFKLLISITQFLPNNFQVFNSSILKEV